MQIQSLLKPTIYDSLPASAFRAMNQAAMSVYEEILNEGTQKNILNNMQTRDQLYETLDYIKYEKQIDALYIKHFK